MSRRSFSRGCVERIARGVAFAASVASAGFAVTPARAATVRSLAAVERSGVGTVKARKACITETVRVTGFAIARDERRLGLPQPAYRISEILVKEGDSVEANQDLVRASPVETGAGATGNGAPATLRAPAAGLVTQVAATAGDVTGGPAAAAQPMVTISVGSGIDLVVDVPSPYAARVRKGAGAHVHGLDGVDAKGTVASPVSTVNAATQLGQARVEVDGASRLKPGQFADARIEVERDCGVTIPQAAVTLRDGVSSVQVLNGATIETRKIRTGLSDDADIQVSEGLSEGETVVASTGSGVDPAGAAGPGGPANMSGSP